MLPKLMKLCFNNGEQVFLTFMLLGYQVACMHTRVVWGGPMYTLCNFTLTPLKCIPSLLHPLQVPRVCPPIP